MTPRLVTIPISHYCEKARWALDRAAVPYEERRHLQVFHYLAVKRAGGGISVPALATDDGTFGDSTDILKWIHGRAPAAGLYPDDAARRAQVEALEDLFDETLGPATRRVIYFHVLDSRAIAFRYNCTGVPRYQRWALHVVLPGARWFLRRRLKIDAAAAGRDVETIRGVFEDVADRLADGRRYLTGDRFTAADLTFAALAAPVLLPAQYGVPLPPRDEVPPAMQTLVDDFRATPAGRFALRLFAEDRAARA